MAFGGNRQNPAPVFSTAEMGGGGAELFTPAYWSYLLVLVAVLWPLMVQSMAWQPGTRQCCQC